MFKQIAALICMVALCAACSSYQPTGDTDSLEHLQQMRTDKNHSKSESTKNIRLEAVRTTALSLGAQAGLAARAKVINSIVENQTGQLDKIYDFRQLLLPHNILPPILTEGRGTLHLASNDAIRITDRTYHIVKQARFVDAPPNWRNYLGMNFTQPERPDNTLLPTNKEEQKIWNAAVAEGWKEGIAQANSIFDADLSRLNRDFEGMALYRKLYVQNMVSAPFVARTDLGVTTGNDSLNVNDQVLRIAANPQFNSQTKHWDPVIDKSTFGN